MDGVLNLHFTRAPMLYYSNKCSGGATILRMPRDHAFLGLLFGLILAAVFLFSGRDQ